MKPEKSRNTSPQHTPKGRKDWRSKGRPHVSNPRDNNENADRRIYGIHAVEALLKNPQRTIHRILLTENAALRLADAAKSVAATIESVHPRDLDRILGADAVHQGALVEAEPLPEPPLDDVCESALSSNRPIVVLDQVTDPHNVGAILRSSAVFGAAALVMTRRNSPPLAHALAKAASGALELVPVVLVPNLAQALAKIGDHAITRIGLDGDSDVPIENARASGTIAIVLGSEGRGLRRLTREHCDILCRIGAAGAMASLNVSNAAAIALFATAQTHPKT